MSDALPSFLEPWNDTEENGLPYKNAIFRHAQPLGPVHAMWWPCKQNHAAPEVVLIFVPGNPGLLGFYPPFLSALQDKTSSAKLAILAHAHVGHTPGVEEGAAKDATRFGLTTQVQSAIEALDAVKETFGEKTKIVLLGHSVGSWFSLQVLKARPSAVDGLFLLFPTISNMANTPNGRSLSWIFRNPIPHIISSVSPIARMPVFLLSLLFPSWPRFQIQVLHSLLWSPTCIFATLSMAHDEMTNVRELDMATLKSNKDRIWFYYAENDNWVGSEREAVLQAIEADPDSVKVVRGHRDIPHAFCINHGEQLASQCYEWLKSGAFI